MILSAARLFDGEALHSGKAVVVEDGRIAAVQPRQDAPGALSLGGGILAPGFVDLQVNGGGGVMLGGSADRADQTRRIHRICAAHARLGAAVLPTLITDRPEVTRAVIGAAIDCAGDALPGFLGLHLEGPHLDPRRPGAHDPALIRPMDDADLALLVDAAAQLPALMVTLAPCAVRPAQIAALAAAGAIVSLGHAACSHDEARAAIAAGASCATHLFNAMSPLESREPGLVGAALDSGIDCGVICDGVHVHPVTLRAALAAKRAGRVFLVSDAMAVAATGDSEFALAGRRIVRQDGRLMLEDGTLAGADLDLATAAGNAVRLLGLPLERALAMATRLPADVIGSGRGRLAPGAPADLVHLSDDLTLLGVWQAGRPLRLLASSFE